METVCFFQVEASFNLSEYGGVHVPERNNPIISDPPLPADAGVVRASHGRFPGLRERSL